MKERKKTGKKQSISDIWGDIKQFNAHIMAVLEVEKMGQRKII